MNKLIDEVAREYLRKHYPDEEDKIMNLAEQQFLMFKAENHDLGGKENLLADNLDYMIAVAALYEASDHRMAGDAIDEMLGSVAKKYAFVGKLINANKPWQLKILRTYLYHAYRKYAKDVKTHDWGNTWEMEVNPRNTKEGICWTLVGCPLADFAKKYGYEELLPHLCAADHIYARLLHAKLIRTHTVATGSDTCDYWYIPDQSRTLEKYKDVKIL